MQAKIKEEIKNAMRAKDVITRDVLKMVVNKAKMTVKENNPNDNSDTISDEIMMQAIQKEIKQLNQTKDSLKGREDSDLYITTEKKLEILKEYLPKMMSKEEVEKAVANILSNGNFTNFGLKMKAVMTELKGKADNKTIKEVVEADK